MVVIEVEIPAPRPDCYNLIASNYLGVTSDDSDLRYKEVNNKSNPPLFSIHGFKSSSSKTFHGGKPLDSSWNYLM